MERNPPVPTCATEAEAELWAGEWWEAKKHNVRAHDGAFYFEPDGLYELLEERDGKPAPVKLLRLSWLLRRLVNNGELSLVID